MACSTKCRRQNRSHHIGYSNDRALAKNTSHVDVIVGGHTHVTLGRPVYVMNKLLHKVPIVQAGSHGTFLGEMILKISDSQSPAIVSYKLHRIDDEIPEDPEIAKLVGQ